MLKQMQTLIVPDSNQLIYQIARTRVAKRCINSFVVFSISLVIRSLLYTYFSIVLIFNNSYLDFFVQCGISILLCLNNGYIQGFVDRFNIELYGATRYVINNYNERNYRKWKIYVTFITLTFLYVYFLFFEITSYLMQTYILQYAFCFVFIDMIENKEHPIRKRLQYIFSPVTKLVAKIKSVAFGITFERGQYYIIDPPKTQKPNKPSKLESFPDETKKVIIVESFKENHVSPTEPKSILKRGFSSEFDIIKNFPKSQSGFEIIC
jgi:hypothetical protein